MIYRELEVYKRAYKLALEIHKWSLQSISREMQFDLGSQIRRASRSIPSNIAEGFGRHNSKKDICNFLNMSVGSTDEVLFNVNFLFAVKLMDKQIFDHFFEEYTIVSKQLFNLIDRVKHPVY